MPVFGFAPDPFHADDPAWNASQHHGPCYVAAPDERRARLFAANTLANPKAPLTKSGLRPASPWIRHSLAVRVAVPRHIAALKISRQDEEVGVVWMVDGQPWPDAAPAWRRPGSGS
jgi:hypothetical protein